MAKNIQSLQLLRNTSVLYETRDVALTKLTGGTIQGGIQDGTPVLARYKGTDGKIYTLVGYYADSSAITGGDSAASHMTVFDIEGSAADVNELKIMIGTGVTTTNTVTKQLQYLSGTTSDTSATTSVAGAKKYADEKVRAALDVLSATSLADDNKVVSDVTQTNGKVTVTVKNLTDVKLDGLSATADTKITSTDTLGGALAKLQGQIDSMDKAAEAVNGQVVTTVSEVDGKVSEAKANVKDLQLVGYSKDTSATGDIASSDTINTALSKLENKVGANKVSNADHSIVVTEPTGATTTDIKVNINSNEKVIKLGDNGIYTNLNLVKITTGLTANVKERYELRDSDDAKIGDSIEIPKDSALQNVYLGHVDDKLKNADGQGESDDKEITNGTGDAALVYVMQLSSGKYKLIAVNVESFLSESEFADGLQVKNHVVSVKVDTSSEQVTTGDNATVDVLTVGSNGVKVSNVQNAINYAISKLDANVTGGDITSKHVQVVVDEVDGKLTTVTVNEANIADADKLEDLSGKTVTEVASSNDSIEATLSAATNGTKHLDIITDASKIKMAGFTKADALTNITESSSVTEAFKEVDKVITDKAEVISNALNDLETTKAEKTALDAEIAARKAVDGQDGDTYAANTSAKYISGATTLNDADVKLNDAIASLDTDVIKSVKVNDVKLAETSNAVNVQISSVKASGTDSSPIVVNTDNNTGAVTLQILQIDCGEY